MWERVNLTVSVLPKVNPYPGLRPFQEQDAVRFFGRDREIDDVLNRLASRHLLAVIGVSGCGKSSLVRAGMIPVLRVGASESLPARWRIYTIYPGNAPLQALRGALGAPSDWPITSFDLVGHMRTQLNNGESLLLVVDQFEEIFRYRDETLAQDGGNAASLFVNLLLNAVEQREIPIYVLLTMRTDYLGQCSQFLGLPEALNDCYYLVPRLTRLQQQEAIERPLQEQGTVMHPALVQRLLNESAEDPDHLPVLQHLLRRLWENWNARGVNGPIGTTDYDDVGGWEDALNADAEHVLKQFEDDLEAIKRVFQWITDRGTGEQPVRRPRPVTECLEVSGLTRERLTEIIRSFHERGVLLPSDQPLINLSHESVMWQWSRLKVWIAEEAQHATQLRFLLQASQNRVPLTGLALESGLRSQSEWRRQKQSALRYLSSNELNETDAWIIRSEQLEHSSRRRRFWIFGAVGALVLAVIAVWLTWQQRNSAEARELSAWAAVSLAEDPERSLILGLHAWDKHRGMVPGLAEILHSAVLQSSSRRTLRGHRGPVWSIAWSPDGSKLATASGDNTAKVWEASSGRELLTLRGHQDAVWSIAWSPDGSKLATASWDKTAKVWLAISGQEVVTLSGHTDRVVSIAWSPDGNRLATTSWDQTAKLWDATSGRELLTLRGHQRRLRNVAWSPDGSKVATASEDKTAKVWEAATGRLLLTLEHQGRVRSIAWSPDGSKLATAGEEITAKVWSDSGQELLTLHGHQGSISAVTWSPDGSRLATASEDATGKVWETISGRELLALRGHQGRVSSIAWSADGNRLATASNDGTAKVWEAGPNGELLTLRGHRGRVWSIAWSPDGSKLATAGDDHTARVWAAATGFELLTLRSSQDPVVTIAWSPDGSKLATAGDDKMTTVWDTSSGAKLHTIAGHTNSIGTVVWSPDGKKLATASDDATAKIWDAFTGRNLLTLSGHKNRVVSIAWSPDGSTLATAGWDQAAKVWDVVSGREVVTLLGHLGSVLSIAWSPDGSKLATTSSDTTTKIWEAASGRELLTLRGHLGSVVGVDWSRDGSKVATASDDSTLKVWESDTGRELLTLRGGHRAPVMSVAWSPDGKLLASTGDDGIAQVYSFDQLEFLRLVRSRITRDMSPEECRRYLNRNGCPELPTVP